MLNAKLTIRARTGQFARAPISATCIDLGDQENPANCLGGEGQACMLSRSVVACRRSEY